MVAAGSSILRLEMCNEYQSVSKQTFDILYVKRLIKNLRTMK